MGKVDPAFPIPFETRHSSELTRIHLCPVGNVPGLPDEPYELSRQVIGDAYDDHARLEEKVTFHDESGLPV